jgi:signal transduction histidine kinase
MIYISIQDSGKGIPPDVRDRIFEPFYTTKATGEGTGLGLSISDSIVKRHGGTIEFSSENGKGSCFTVYLPIKPDTASNNGEAE